MRARRTSRWLRAGLLLLAVQAAVVGVWALFVPHGFFADFPGVRGGWISSLPPYNEHLVRDIGAFYFAFAVLFFWVTMTLDRAVMRVALITWLIAAIPHLIFHFSNGGRLSSLDRALQLGGLALVVVLPLLLLFTGRRRKGTDFTWARNG
jgi:hypothetical protein